MRDILDLHTHTLASGHAYNTIFEMAKAASEKGLELLGITEHAPKMPGTCHEYYFSNLHVVPRELYGVKLLLGSELNILDYEGNVDLPEYVLEKLDLCIASIHPPCMKAGSRQENTRAVVNAMKNKYISIIGHPDDGRFLLDYEAIVLAAKENNVLLELNNSSLSPNSFRPNTRENDKTMLEICKEYQVPIIMGSDAHISFDVGRHDNIMPLLKEVDFPEELIMNQSVTKLLEFIKRKRG